MHRQLIGLLTVLALSACATSSAPTFPGTSNSRVGVLPFPALEKLCHVHSGVTKDTDFVDEYTLPAGAASTENDAFADGIKQSGNAVVLLSTDTPATTLTKLSGGVYVLTEAGKAWAAQQKEQHSLDYLAVPWRGFGSKCYGVTFYTGKSPTGSWYPPEVFSPHRMQVFELETFQTIGDTKQLGSEGDEAKSTQLPKDAKRLTDEEITEYTTQSLLVRVIAMRRFFSTK